MKGRVLMAIVLATLLLTGCQTTPKPQSESEQPRERPWTLETFADVNVRRYELPGWEQLTPKQRVLAYYLTQAALCGRDILMDQNCQYNLSIRRILEGIYTSYTGNRQGAPWEQFYTYLKRVWFANGIHHFYAETKMAPGFPQAYFQELVENTPQEAFPQKFATKEEVLAYANPVLFDPTVAAKRVNKADGVDVVATSATNLYRNLTQKEVEKFYAAQKKAHKNDTHLAYGMNSQLVKQADGTIVERVWKVGGMYSAAIEQIVGWLEKAKTVAETPEQVVTLNSLIKFYQTGALEDFNQYCVDWMQDTAARIDFVNGFIEDYGDPLGSKCSWEGLVNYKDMEATQRMEVLSANAQWFEDNSPVDKKFKKEKVKGLTAKVIDVVQLGGDCYPMPPIGINLPNANWFRKEHGSKSVTIANLMYAYDKASEGNGFLEEFAYGPEEVARIRECGALASNVSTDLHECLGHGSGQLLKGVKDDALKNYTSTIEEARADLFSLYYIADPKMEELGILPSQEYAWAEYDTYMRNGLLTQISRLKPGEQIEEDHMRNRALIARWCYEKGKGGKVIEMASRDGKTYVKVNDYQALRGLVGQLLAEVQRVRSTGDFKAAKALVEGYGVAVDPELHKEVLARYQQLHIAPYGGFVNPLIEPVMQGDSIVDARVNYDVSLTEQMLYYSKNYSFLPCDN
jgi:hypothetical protein